MKKRLVLIDGHAIIHRAYHALPPLTRKDGTIVNAVFGFSSMLLKVLDSLNPTHLAVAFDVAGGTFRDELFEDYKAHREAADQDLYDQIPFIYDVVHAFNIPVFEKEGYEADDVVGTIVQQVEESADDIEIIIVTGDKDLLQLATFPKTKIALLGRGMSDFSLYDVAEVTEKFGFGPEYIPDYKGLMGDPSDNIPGVKGVGKKTAAVLITQFGSVEDIYKAVEKEETGDLRASVITKLVTDKEKAFLSKELATIKKDVPEIDFSLDAATMQTTDWESVKTLFTDFDFHSLVRRVPKHAPKSTATQTSISLESTVMSLTEKDIATLLQEVHDTVFFLGEYAGTSGHWELESMVFSFENKKLYQITFADVSKATKKQVVSFFATRKNLVGHGVKKFVTYCFQQQITVTAELFDIAIASYLIETNTRAYDLASCIHRLLGVELEEPSAAEVIAYLPELHKIYTEKLAQTNQQTVFEEIEMPLVPVLAEMEATGIAVDLEELQKQSASLQARMAEITQQVHDLAGQEFNIASSVQLREILFEVLALPTKGIKKGKTGYSTAASELEKLHGTHDIIPLIEEHREIAKLQNTYVDVLPKLIHPKTKRIHTTFNQTVTATGRLSSSDPNLQNIPIRTELGKKVRDAFVAEEGNVLIAADYSQIELRVVAALSGDKTLTNIFLAGKDVHKATAAAINNIPLEEVTPELRRAAKEVNFGVLYGMGSFGLASRTGISQKDAKAFIEKYFAAFPQVKVFLNETLATAEEEGYAQTYFGRRRYITELQSSNVQLRRAGERMAVNMPMQGTSADIMKLAMIEVAKELKAMKAYQDGDIKLLLQVHDELVLEVKKGLAEDVAKKVQKIMSAVVEFPVPLEVTAGIDIRWGAMK